MMCRPFLTTAEHLARHFDRAGLPEYRRPCDHRDYCGWARAVSTEIERYCDRALTAPSTVVAYQCDGSGYGRIVLPEWPAAQVQSVHSTRDGANWRCVERFLWTVADAQAGYLDLVSPMIWRRGTQNVLIWGRLGYDPQNPAHQGSLANLREAANTLALHWLTTRATVGDGPRQWPLEVTEALSAYRRQPSPTTYPVIRPVPQTTAPAAATASA